MDAPTLEQRRLTRGAVLEGALTLLDDVGLAGFSMRRLGRGLGVEAMAVYHWFPSRGALLDAVVDRVVDELFGDPITQVSPDDGWEVFLTRLAHGVRGVAHRHPRVFPIIASRPTSAPWVRPPLRSLRWLDAFLEELVARGFDDEQAVAAYRSFTTLLLGSLLLEVSALGADLGPEDELEHQPGALRLGEHPTVERLSGLLREDHAEEEFAIALRALLSRLGSDLRPAALPAPLARV